MKNTIICLSLLTLCVASSFLLECSAEKVQLQENIIRLHVVANSNSPEDQAQKLRVRDTVVAYLSPLLSDITSVDTAKEHISCNISHLEDIVRDFLNNEGSQMPVRISLAKESFDTRYYDTFALPAGIYSSLRIELGEGEGKNWWCVAFPALCMPAAGKDFRDVATGAGFSDDLTASLASGTKFEVRFFVLDLLGRLENFFNKR